MARPTFSEVFGPGSQIVAVGDSVSQAGIFISAETLFPGGGFSDPLSLDAQVIFLALVLEASKILNEANRNNNMSGIVSTVTYGEYDNIIDPPGSTNVFRRDVFSLIAYQAQAYQPFDPGGLNGGGGGSGGGS